MMAFGPALRQARKLAGLNQRQLAALCDVHPSTISYWETDDMTPVKACVDRLMRELPSFAAMVAARQVAMPSSKKIAKPLGPGPRLDGIVFRHRS